MSRTIEQWRHVELSGSIPLRLRLRSHYRHFLRSFGKEGKGPGEFNWPTAIAMDKDGRICITDRKNGRIQVLWLSIITTQIYMYCETMFLLPVYSMQVL